MGKGKHVIVFGGRREGANFKIGFVRRVCFICIGVVGKALSLIGSARRVCFCMFWGRRERLTGENPNEHSGRKTDHV